MSILKYKVINPIIDRKKPHVDKHGVFIVPDIKYKYNYYIEVSNYNNTINTNEYFVLLGADKFDEQCRKCNVDNYGRLKFNIHGELKDFITNEINDRGNIEFSYILSENNYDVWQIS